MLRSKTDRPDVATIAHFYKFQTPGKWKPDIPCIKELRQVMCQIEDLKSEFRCEKIALKVWKIISR
ncbi:MAG: hypothetical protein J7M18_01285 [Candidatus Eremiobacteraeota bacterium]|nr:hypothetical protein [Candidatus Eremiobacteraeota bacterium]